MSQRVSVAPIVELWLRNVNPDDLLDVWEALGRKREHLIPVRGRTQTAEGEPAHSPTEGGEGSPEANSCPECEGVGWFGFGDGPEDPNAEYESCARCDGTGNHPTTSDSSPHPSCPGDIIPGAGHSRFDELDYMVCGLHTLFEGLKARVDTLDQTLLGLVNKISETSDLQGRVDGVTIMATERFDIFERRIKSLEGDVRRLRDIETARQFDAMEALRKKVEAPEEREIVIPAPDEDECPPLMEPRS